MTLPPSLPLSCPLREFILKRRVTPGWSPSFPLRVMLVMNYESRAGDQDRQYDRKT